MKKYIGLPSDKSIFVMLNESLTELNRKGIINVINPDEELRRISLKCVGFSGRVIRKLPLLALQTIPFSGPLPIASKQFIDSLSSTIDAEKLDRNILSENGDKAQ